MHIFRGFLLGKCDTFVSCTTCRTLGEMYAEMFVLSTVFVLVCSLLTCVQNCDPAFFTGDLLTFATGVNFEFVIFPEVRDPMAVPLARCKNQRNSLLDINIQQTHS